MSTLYFSDVKKFLRGFLVVLLGVLGSSRWVLSKIIMTKVCKMENENVTGYRRCRLCIFECRTVDLLNLIKTVTKTFVGQSETLCEFDISLCSEAFFTLMTWTVSSIINIIQQLKIKSKLSIINQFPLNDTLTLCIQINIL